MFFPNIKFNILTISAYGFIRNSDKEEIAF